MILAYCDKIADEIRNKLVKSGHDSIIGLVGRIKMDLHPSEGYMLSTKKTIDVTDTNGKMYRVTVEEL
jgi:hypothetical protein